MTAQPHRCAWARHALEVHYHDTEWGVPTHDDRQHFEYLVLDGAQAGLSWLTILKKRPAYREAFAGWDVAAVARYGEAEVERLLGDAGIVRNRKKIESAIRNARAFLEVQEAFASFDAYIWQFVEGATVVNRYRQWREIPAKTERSDAMSKDLKQRGFNFVGSTICYAYMQAAGMVNDHEVDCFRWAEVQA